MMDGLKFTTSKINANMSRIHVNGEPTDFVIVRGEDPKFGMGREWHVGLSTDEKEGPWLTAYPRKADALWAFEQIYTAGFSSAKGGA